tara:strand:- start:116 stop:265 length:150 start_codon:yes stop_codon:yes gene_type:complete
MLKTLRGDTNMPGLYGKGIKKKKAKKKIGLMPRKKKGIAKKKKSRGRMY